VDIIEGEKKHVEQQGTLHKTLTSLDNYLWSQKSLSMAPQFTAILELEKVWILVFWFFFGHVILFWSRGLFLGVLFFVVPEIAIHGWRRKGFLFTFGSRGHFKLQATF
jgi:hypothetical protein